MVNKMSRSISRFRPSPRDWRLAIPVCIALGGFVVRMALGPITIDDAYITFRYARNVADGVGFVYKPGERILGTTTPLWTLLLAAFCKIGACDLPLVALVFGATADAATTLLLFQLARHLGLGRGWGALLSTLFAVSAASITFTAGGMETPLFVLEVVGAVFADATGRPRRAAVIAGLATLTRPEGILMAVLVLGKYLLVGRFPPGRDLVSYLATVVPWVTFATWYFGSALPQSVIAKAAVFEAPPTTNAVLLLTQIGLPGMNLEQLYSSDETLRIAFGLPIGVFITLTALASAPRLARYLRGHPECLTLVGFAPLLAIAYMVAGARNVILFYWYVVPLVPFYLFGIVVFLQRVTTRLPRIGVAAIASALLFWTVLGMGLGRDAKRSLFWPVGLSLSHEESYREAASFLAPRIDSTSTVALPEIGTFGYYSRSRILDTAALISPQAARYYPLPAAYHGHAVPADLIRDAKPDYLVTPDIYLQGPLADATWFQRQYRLIATFDSPWILNARTVLVYQRVGA